MDYLMLAYAAVAVGEFLIWSREIPWALAAMMRARALLDDHISIIGGLSYYILFFLCVVILSAFWPLTLIFTSRSLLQPYNRFSVMRQAMHGVYMARSKR